MLVGWVMPLVVQRPFLVVVKAGGAGVGRLLGWGGGGKGGIACVGFVFGRIIMHTRLGIHYALMPTPRGGLLSRLALTVTWDSSTGVWVGVGGVAAVSGCGATAVENCGATAVDGCGAVVLISVVITDVPVVDCNAVDLIHASVFCSASLALLYDLPVRLWLRFCSSMCSPSTRGWGWGCVGRREWSENT